MAVLFKIQVGCLAGAMVLGKLSVPGAILIWIIVGQGPTALAVGAGGCRLATFGYHYSSFSLSLGDGPISTDILSQRAIKPKTTNQSKFKFLLCTKYLQRSSSPHYY